MGVNWYPGHMVKARREIENNLKLVDLVIILLDARAPFSCRNPDIETLVKKKKIIVVLNKTDLASPEWTKIYLARLKNEGYSSVQAMDSISGKGSREVVQAISRAFADQEKELIKKNRRLRPVRVMVVGVPNVGKSTFLNCLVGQKVANTGAMPGVTRGKQWVRIRKDIEFMDTPGLMWPKIKEAEQGLKLALLGIVGENAYNTQEVAIYLLRVLKSKHPDALTAKYRLDDHERTEDQLLEDIARSRGYLLKGGAPDLEKSSISLLRDFRKGFIGRISLD
jgi:ribosome biogenesis GTPase A